MLNVETGVGLEDSESYVTVAECTAYHAKHGGTAWDAVDDQEAALRKATQYLDSVYQWRGDRVFSTQALKWPRLNVVVDGYELPGDEIPAKLKAACCELAAKGELFADVSAQQVDSVKVGPIERKMSGLLNGGQVRYAAVDALVRELVRGGSGSASISLVRA